MTNDPYIKGQRVSGPVQHAQTEVPRYKQKTLLARAVRARHNQARRHGTPTNGHLPPMNPDPQATQKAIDRVREQHQGTILERVPPGGGKADDAI